MKLIASALTAHDLIEALQRVPDTATIEVRSTEYYDGVEVWYDEATDAVILK